MSRRQDAATATVGAGLTATGGYLRHAGVQELIRAQGGKEPKVHGLAIARHGNPLSRKLYAAGAISGVIGAPALGIGGTRFIRRKQVIKRDKDSFLQEGIKGTGQALTERKDAIAQRNVPTRARAAGLATTAGAGSLGVLAARGLLRHKGGGTKALISPVAGVLAGAAATPLSSRVVNRVSPGYEVTPAGVKRKKKALKRASSASYQHREAPRSFQADIAKGDEPPKKYDDLHYARIRRMLRNNPHLKGQVDEFLEMAKQPLPNPQREVNDYMANRLAEIRRSTIKPAPAPVRTGMHPHTKIMLGAVGAAGALSLLASRQQKQARRSKVKKDASTRRYRAKVMAAGTVPVPGVNWAAQARTAGALAPTGQKRRAEGTQFAGSATGDVAGFLGGAHGAAYLAEHHAGFKRGAETANAHVENVRSHLPKLPTPKINMPAGASSGRAGRVIRAAVRPLKNPKTAAAAAVGGLAGQAVVGNALQQAAMTRNIHQGRVKKLDTGMTQKEQQKQLKRRARLIAVNTMGATTGAAGLATFAASRHPHFHAQKPALQTATLGLSAIGGGIGSYGGFKRAKVERRDLRAQRKALGVAKGMNPKFDDIIGTYRSPKNLWDSTRRKKHLIGVRSGSNLAVKNQLLAREMHGPIDVGKGMPDQSALSVPTGLVKTKTYAASSVRATPTGKLVRTKAGMR